MDNTRLKRGLAETIKDEDLEKIQRLMEWAELIHKDLGDFIGALDRFYLEKNSIGKSPGKDFLVMSK